ncbi:CDP-archaeol synthase [Candidatus Woesearchaeota archaeon]|nr:CDP-archaeol synthase [Candidatus Woesearchaeota archaeon]
MTASEILEYVLELFYLMLPGILANMMPVLAARWKILNFLAKPIDSNKKWLDNKPILGKHKTYRGFILGIAVAMLVAFIQFKLYNLFVFKSLSIIPYDRYNPFLLGFLIGFGVLLGDSVKSFFKRRLNIKPGKPFFPFDQIDSVIGGLLFVSIIYIPTFKLVVSLLALSLVTHLAVRTIGYYTGISKERW